MVLLHIVFRVAAASYFYCHHVAVLALDGDCGGIVDSRLLPTALSVSHALGQQIALAVCGLYLAKQHVRQCHLHQIGWKVGSLRGPVAEGGSEVVHGQPRAQTAQQVPHRHFAEMGSRRPLP